MPGIAGIIGRTSPHVGVRLATSMAAAMTREAFYASGSAACEAAGAYVAWTAHDQSYAAKVSSRSADAVVVLLAGECVGDGKDVEIAELYARHGDDFVTRLNGLFSGCLLDRRRGRALLFNDRYGLERLYIHRTPTATYFASEAKALLRVLPSTRALDPAGLAQQLAFGCTVPPQTLFHRVELLEGATLWTFGETGARQSRYFDPSAWESLPPLSMEAFSSRLREVLSSVLPRYLGGDAAIGLSLTGGLDTRMIAACLPRDVGDLRAYTFSGESPRLLDERLARRIAAHLGVPHDVLRIGTAFVADYARQVDRTVEATDGTFGATGAHEIYLNGLARGLAPVRLTGNFGSEVLRGMSTFKPLHLAPHILDPGLRQAVDRASRAPLVPDRHPVSTAVFGEIPAGLFGSLAAARSQVTFRTPYLDNELVELSFRAPAAARTSALPSLEVVSHGNSALSGIPTDRAVLLSSGGLSRLGRRLFAEITFKLDYFYQEGLPGWLMPAEPGFSVLSRTGLLGLHKFLAYRRWFRAELADHVRQVVTDARISDMPWWNASALPAMLKDHVEGRQNYVREINAILTVEAIDRLLIQNESHVSEEVVEAL